VFLAFQGGGAKGIAHVGGLAAVNDLKLEIIGVAGTSAGAIIAALIAAGYSAKDIFDNEAQSHLLKKVDPEKYSRPIDLFTEDGWKAISRVIRHAKRLSRLTLWCKKERPKLVVWGVKLLAAAFGSVALGALVAWPILTLPLMAGLVALSALAKRYLQKIHTGLAPLDGVRSVIDSALAKKLGLDKKDINFDDLRKLGAAPLKLVATNLSDQSLQLFSFETTPYTPVADAVAASIRLPFIFQQLEIEMQGPLDNGPSRRSFLDGGLLSNLPVWAFDEERELNPNAATIAFGLKASPPSGKYWLQAAMDAVVAGPPQIHRRGVKRLIYVQLECSLGLLDFDASFSKFSSEIHTAREKTINLLNDELTEIPHLVNQQLETLRDLVARGISVRRRLWKIPSPELSFRIALAVQRPDDNLSMTIVYAVGHPADVLGLRIRLDHPVVGAAWTRRDTSDSFLAAFRLDTPMPPAQEADRVFKDSRWLAAVAVPPDATGSTPGTLTSNAVVAVIDSTDELGTNLETNSKRLLFYSDVLKALALQSIDIAEFGRLARRSVSWL